MYRLYDYLPSGNGYKVRLVLKYLRLPYELVEMDIKAGATRAPEFLAKNANGRIPLLEVPGRGYLAESHAIIHFLAADSLLVPNDAWQQAQMWHWLCFEQYNLEPNIGTARFWRVSQKRTPEELGDKLVEKLAKGAEALAVLERQLTGRSWVLGEQHSLADVSLYAYTHVAPEAGLTLEPYPEIRAWIRRIEAEPYWEPISAR
ncbi:MAG: glutathione S-transferase family protein [Proteobacteria bacterium]|nr:glutathione S-transferase family protein [Pseudomonadota bacterium]